jgi:hypothetical protein
VVRVARLDRLHGELPFVQRSYVCCLLPNDSVSRNFLTPASSSW